MILLFLACGEPAFGPEKKALEIFEQAKANYDKKLYHQAALGFQQARQLDIESSNLANWQAISLIKAKQPAEALVILNKQLLKHPGNATLRYNRAAALVAIEQYSAAAKDLAILYHNKKAHPSLVAEDPDFAKLAQQPEFSTLVPKSSLRIQTGKAPSTGLVGELLIGEWSIIHRKSIFSSITVLSPYVDLRRVVEDRSDIDGVLQLTRLELNWVGVKEGIAESIQIPADTAAGSVLSDPFSIEIVRLKSRQVVDSGIDLVIPSQWVPKKPLPWAERLENGWVIVAAPPKTSILISSEAFQDWDFRQAGQTKWVAKMTTDKGPVEVKVRLGEKTLLQRVFPALEDN